MDSVIVLSNLLVGEKANAYMELRRTQLIEELRAARETLYDINFATDTAPPLGVSRPYALVSLWLTRWSTTFNKVYTFTNRGIDLYHSIDRQLGGYQDEEDPEIFNELRPELVECIDEGLRVLDAGYKVKPFSLEDYIKRVKDIKLAELLKEFNEVIDTAPNLAAIEFRTILSLVIQEKAKRVNPTSKTATRTDLGPSKMIDCARNETILSKDEQRLVNSFVSTYKDIYDLVTHRPGILIDKYEVYTMVDLLNKLLPAIIN